MKPESLIVYKHSEGQIISKSQRPASKQNTNELVEKEISVSAFRIIMTSHKYIYADDTAIFSAFKLLLTHSEMKL